MWRGPVVVRWKLSRAKECSRGGEASAFRLDRRPLLDRASRSNCPALLPTDRRRSAGWADLTDGPATAGKDDDDNDNDPSFQPHNATAPATV
jgi:hypothetical protein|eukprot:9629-Pelagococcus_subviridis.AAC.7